MNNHPLLKTILLFVLMFLIVAFVMMSMWNWLMPPVFGFSEVNYLQAGGMLVLARILFGGEGFYFKRRWRNAWGNHLKNKMESMSPQEQEHFRQRWEEICGKLKENDR
ncbi:MAG: hypothetical protein RLZZ630_410 [Bacteroidota bacterium]|jgi:hypothetical protein